MRRIKWPQMTLLSRISCLHVRNVKYPGEPDSASDAVLAPVLSSPALFL